MCQGIVLSGSASLVNSPTETKKPMSVKNVAIDVKASRQVKLVLYRNFVMSSLSIIPMKRPTQVSGLERNSARAASKREVERRSKDKAKVLVEGSTSKPHVFADGV